MRYSVKGKEKMHNSSLLSWILISVSSMVNLKALADFVLARSISKKLSINAKSFTTENTELWRGIRSQLAALLDGLDPKDLATMSLGLSHSLSR